MVSSVVCSIRFLTYSILTVAMVSSSTSTSGSAQSTAMAWPHSWIRPERNNRWVFSLSIVFNDVTGEMLPSGFTGNDKKWETCAHKLAHNWRCEDGNFKKTKTKTSHYTCSLHLKTGHFIQQNDHDSASTVQSVAQILRKLSSYAETIKLYLYLITEAFSFSLGEKQHWFITQSNSSSVHIMFSNS